VTSHDLGFDELNAFAFVIGIPKRSNGPTLIT
jgi:hypothetical protein